MIPVVAAIVTAVLAGGIALYRERRLELAALLVAARVTRSVCLGASQALVAGSADDVDPRKRAGLTERFMQAVSVAEVWPQHRDVLARHLREDEWNEIDNAILGVAVLQATAERPLESDAGARAMMKLVSKRLDEAASVLAPYGAKAGARSRPGTRRLRPPVGSD